MNSRRLEVCCCIANVLAAFWGYFYPYPYSPCLAVLIAMPWLCILAARVTGDDRNRLTVSTLFPVAALLARTVADFYVTVTVAHLLAITGCLGALAVAVVFLMHRKAWRKYGLVLIAVSLAYAFAAFPAANFLFDKQTQRFSAAIISRDYFIGRHSDFRLVLAPWGDNRQPNENSVSWNTYLGLHSKNVACIDAGPGAFHMPWHKVSACPNHE